MKQKPVPKRTDNFSLARLGIVIMIVGIVVSAVYFVALKTNTSDFGSIGDGLAIIYGGLPITLLGLILFFIGLVMARRRKK